MDDDNQEVKELRLAIRSLEIALNAEKLVRFHSVKILLLALGQLGKPSVEGVATGETMAGYFDRLLKVEMNSRLASISDENPALATEIKSLLGFLEDKSDEPNS